jgi:hypothetical protein
MHTSVTKLEPEEKDNVSQAAGAVYLSTWTAVTKGYKPSLMYLDSHTVAREVTNNNPHVVYKAATCICTTTSTVLTSM